MFSVIAGLFVVSLLLTVVDDGLPEATALQVLMFGLYWLKWIAATTFIYIEWSLCAWDDVYEVLVNFTNTRADPRAPRQRSALIDKEAGYQAVVQKIVELWPGIPVDRMDLYFGIEQQIPRDWRVKDWCSDTTTTEVEIRFH